MLGFRRCQQVNIFGVRRIGRREGGGGMVGERRGVEVRRRGRLAPVVVV